MDDLLPASSRMGCSIPWPVPRRLFPHAPREPPCHAPRLAAARGPDRVEWRVCIKQQRRELGAELLQDQAARQTRPAGAPPAPSPPLGDLGERLDLARLHAEPTSQAQHALHCPPYRRRSWRSCARGVRDGTRMPCAVCAKSSTSHWLDAPCRKADRLYPPPSAMNSGVPGGVRVGSPQRADAGRHGARSSTRQADRQAAGGDGAGGVRGAVGRSPRGSDGRAAVAVAGVHPAGDRLRHSAPAPGGPPRRCWPDGHGSAAHEVSDLACVGSRRRR